MSVEAVEHTDSATDLTEVIHGQEQEWLPEDKVAEAVALVIFSLVQRDSMTVHGNNQAIFSVTARITREEIEDLNRRLLEAEKKMQENEHSKSIWSQVATGINITLSGMEVITGAALAFINIPLGVAFIADGVLKGTNEYMNVSGAHEKIAANVLPGEDKDKQQELAAQLHQAITFASMAVSIGLIAVGGGALKESTKWISNMTQTFGQMGGAYAAGKNGKATAKGYKYQALWSDTETETSMKRAQLDEVTQRFSQAGQDMHQAVKGSKSDVEMKITKAIAAAAA